MLPLQMSNTNVKLCAPGSFAIRTVSDGILCALQERALAGDDAGPLAADSGLVFARGCDRNF